jgi:hypothetical protein
VTGPENSYRISNLKNENSIFHYGAGACLNHNMQVYFLSYESTGLKKTNKNYFAGFFCEG